MAKAGGEDGEEDGEDHDGEANHHATDPTLPSMRQHSLLEIFLPVLEVVKGIPFYPKWDKNRVKRKECFTNYKTLLIK